MNSPNPYEQLGVSEDSSFEEIQETRNRLVQEHQANPQQVSAIEAAYDAVLMDRLRLRQEGKIKVPDRIRFPEKAPPPTPPASILPSPASGSAWLRNWFDRPTLADVAVSAGVFLACGALTYAAPQFLQAVLIGAVGACFYFLYRKEQRLGRTVFLGLTGLVSGFAIGGVLAGLLMPQVTALALAVDQVAAFVTFILLWLVSSFLR